MEVMAPFLGKYHQVFTDKLYTSVATATELKKRKTYMTGAVKSNSKGLPRDFKTDREILRLPKTTTPRGTYHVRQNDSGLTCAIWKDSKVVIFLSAAHQMESAETTHLMRQVRPSPKERRVLKHVKAPQSAVDYTRNLSGVDRHDQLRAYHTCARKSQRWWKQLLYFLVDVARTNAYICFKHSKGLLDTTGTAARCLPHEYQPPVRSSEESSPDSGSDEEPSDGSIDGGVDDGSIKHSSFVVDLACGLIGGYAAGASKRKQRVKHIQPVSAANAVDHELLPMTSPQCKYPRQCVWCKKVGKTTPSGNPIMSRFGCDLCDVHLCSQAITKRTCFVDYHSAEAN